MLKELIGLKELQQILEDSILKNLMICTFIMGWIIKIEVLGKQTK